MKKIMKYAVLLAIGQLYASSDEALGSAVSLAENNFGTMSGSEGDSEGDSGVVQTSIKKAPVLTSRRRAPLPSFDSSSDSSSEASEASIRSRQKQHRTAQGAKGKADENVRKVARSLDRELEQGFDENRNFLRGSGLPTKAETQARLDVLFLDNFARAEKEEMALERYAWLLQHPQLVRDIQIEYLMWKLGILEENFDLATLDSLITAYKLNEIEALQTAAMYYLKNHDNTIAGLEYLID